MASMPNSKQIGDETEAVVISRLIGAGYSVSIPFGDNDGYDLIVDDSSQLHRVQCKTAWHNSPNTIRFNTHSQTTKNGEYHEDAYSQKIDSFMVRDPENETLYWIEIGEATQQKMDLRFDSKIDHPSINWVSDYLFSGSLSES